MTEFTFGGATGDFAKVMAAYQYLQSLGPLGDDFVFYQVGDTIENVWIWPPSVNLNDHYVKFICPWENSHQGDSTRGYKIFITNGMSVELRGEGSIASQIILDGLFFDKTDNLNTNLIVCGSWHAASTTNVQTYILRNIIFKSTANIGNGGRAIKPTSTQYNQFYFYNLKFKLFNQAINSQIGGGVAGDHWIENVTIDECGEGISWLGLGHAWNIRNVVSINGSNWGNMGGGGNNNLINCADDDNSMAASGANLIDCIPNIIPANEFQSLNFADENWLKLIKGIAQENPDGTWTYSGGAPDLGKTGTAPGITGHNTDISRLPIPGADGAYSIGAHELEYIIRLVNKVFNRLILDSGAVYMNFQSIDNPGILLGATREGNVFTIEQELRDVPVDGAKGFVKNGRRYIRSNIKLTCNFIEHTLDLWQLAVSGSETTVLPEHVKLYRNLSITDDDYIDNIVIVAQMSGTNQSVICGVKNALADSNIELGSEEGNETKLPITFTAHYDSCNLDKEPFILMYPETNLPTTSTTTAAP